MSTTKERKKCIFCNFDLHIKLFENDLETFAGHYAVEKNTINYQSIPYNVLICDNCNTAQLKYLADLNEVYKINHADGTGNTMMKLHQLNKKLVLKHKEKINNIIEIGSSKGIFADLLLDEINMQYYIIEPNFIGNSNKKIIVNDFYENVNDNEIDANTIFMSHVFEHFYEPFSILEKIYNNTKIKNVFLTFPDLENYIEKNINHVLNTEHTYYIDNKFLINLFKKFGFCLVEKIKFKGHSVLFYFERRYKKKIKPINFKNSKNKLKKFFKTIISTTNKINDFVNKYNNIYLWPASVHTLMLCTFGLQYQKIKGLLDNSELKINKKMYGMNTEIFPFSHILNKKNKAIIILNGGVFNKEIKKQIKSKNIKIITYN